jgi:hypothetical protein
MDNRGVYSLEYSWRSIRMGYQRIGVQIEYDVLHKPL